MDITIFGNRAVRFTERISGPAAMLYDIIFCNFHKSHIYLWTCTCRDGMDGDHDIW